jgi:ribokinase
VAVARFPAPGETVLGGDVARHPGGKGANQAVAAARAGARVAMVGRVGRDGFGEELLLALAGDGVDASRVLPLDDVATGMAFIEVGPGGQNRIVVASGANARLDPDALERGAFAGARVVVLQLEVPLPTGRRAARLGREAGARVVLNLAPAERLSADDLADVDVLVVNESEAALLTGLVEEDVAASPDGALALLARLVPATVVTLGAAGAAWHDGDAVGRVAGIDVTPVDTTAAGDAFVGALAARLAEGATLAEAVAFGNAAGALAVTGRGAQPSLPTRRAIERLLEATRTPR